EIGAFGDAASEVAIRTAALGGPYPLQAAPSIESKFGPFDSFDFVASTEGTPRQCLGFMRAFEKPRLAITGWHCRAGPAVVARGFRQGEENAKARQCQDKSTFISPDPSNNHSGW